MSKVVTYLYPKPEKAGSLKVFQDPTKQIKAFYFTKDHLQDVGRLAAAQNHAIYFIFDETAEEKRAKVIIGQSEEGVDGIKNHTWDNLFWSFSLMFVTDNNLFDALTVDYLERYFSSKFQQSSQYSLLSKTKEKSELNANVYDKPMIYSFIKQIEFLLQVEGINIQEEKADSSTKFFHPVDQKYEAKIFVKDGKFVLAKDSLITKPISSLENWSDGGVFYSTYNKYVNDFLKDKKIKESDTGYRTLENLSFTSPAIIASLISGVIENGWTFFEGLNELKE